MKRKKPKKDVFQLAMNGEKVMANIHGTNFELHLWLVTERTATGVPLKMHFCYPEETMSAVLERCGVEIVDGKPKDASFELMWTPSTYLKPRS